MFTWTKWKKKFPLTSVNDVVNLFEDLLNTNEPNLIFVSILLGLIERKLINHSEVIESDFVTSDGSKAVELNETKVFTLSINEIMPLYKKFANFISEIPVEKSSKKYIDRSTLKIITDKIFQKMTSGKHKELCHSQTIYSFINDYVLDSFGLAYSVVAIAQHFGFVNVRLALSEDHAWVEYDIEDINNNKTDSYSSSTADVAWTGKNEVKRCSPIDSGVLDRSRYYVQGQCVVCDNNKKIVAAAITTINPVKSSQTTMNFYSHRTNKVNHSFELACLKRDLLWLCYKNKLLESYPLALINLADLERNYPKLSYSELDETAYDCPQFKMDSDDNNNIISNNKDVSLLLYKEAVDVNQRKYLNCHVYPYLSMANYFYQIDDYIRAMICWRMAACVISSYNYKTDDWVIYREFFDIATSYIPNIFRSLQHKEDDHHSKSSDSHHCNPDAESNKEMKNPCDELRIDTRFLTEFILYFDYICLWEEGSSVPVLHEVWANKFKEVLIRFTEETRVKLGRIGVDKSISLNMDCPVDKLLDLPRQSSVDQIFCISANEYKPKPAVDKRVVSPRSKRLSNKKTAIQQQTLQERSQLKDFFTALCNGETQNLASILSSKVLNIDFLISNRSSYKLFDNSAQVEPIVDYESLKCENLCQLDMEQKFIDYFSTFKTVKEILNESNLHKHFQRTGMMKMESVDQVLQDLSNAVSNYEYSNTNNNKSSNDDDNNNNNNNNGNYCVKVTDGTTAKRNEDGDFLNTINEIEADIYSKSEVKENSNKNNSISEDVKVDQEDTYEADDINRVTLIEVLRSQKMREICSLIVAPGKLNVPAIKLPLTAQSQVSLKRTGLQSVYGHHNHDYSILSRKRFKKE